MDYTKLQIQFEVMTKECTCCVEQLELFPELIKQWEEDVKWFTILRLRQESDL